MAITIKNLTVANNLISVDVKDPVNQGETALLKLYIGGDLIKEKNIILNYFDQTESFDLPEVNLNYTIRVNVYFNGEKVNYIDGLITQD